MKAKIIMLKCITNLHVGNGEVNYNIIDNEVEKDPNTNLPVINASGVKGALRDFFRGIGSDSIDDIFGRDENKNTTQGKIKILSAQMLARPARASRGDKAFYMLTSPTTLTRFNDICNTFIGKTVQMSEGTIANAAADDVPLSKCKKFNDVSLYIVGDNELAEISLPVMARNFLKNGISNNLWYEEVVPYESIFYFPVVANDGDADLLDEFIDSINGKVVQFGGNASIGYGLCKVSVLE